MTVSPSRQPGFASQVVPPPRPDRPVTLARALRIGLAAGGVGWVTGALLGGFAVISDFGAAFGGHPLPLATDVVLFGIALVVPLVACSGVLRGFLGVPLGWPRAIALGMSLCLVLPLAAAAGVSGIRAGIPIWAAVLFGLALWAAGVAGWALLARRVARSGGPANRAGAL